MSLRDPNYTLCVSRLTSEPVVVRSPKPTHVPDHHILIRVDRFAFSANNITNQVLAEHPHFRHKTHGVLPFWGFATVIKSSHSKIEVGERLLGFFAPTRYLVLPLSDVGEVSMYIPRPHLPADRSIFSKVVRCKSDPAYQPFTEDLMMLYRPLFWASYWCEDWLSCSDYRGNCENLLVSSASSKTGYLFAYCARNADRDIRLIGLTSKKHVSFTKHLGLYDEVYDYDTFLTTKTFQSNPGRKWIYVDVNGNAALTTKIHKHFSSDYTGTLAASISLGLATKSPIVAWEQQLALDAQLGADPTLEPNFHVMGQKSSCANDPDIWPQREQFFTPEWLAVRKKQMDPTEICALAKSEWSRLVQDCQGWVEMEQVYGIDGVVKAYERILHGDVAPDKGLIWSLWDQEAQVQADNMMYQTRL
ncbi:hypothetical protein D9758_003784 [Tetrapyrgos nigripes]|uniref:Uncharacterized protein n=1 Tax=Tetrapyrgos nigripes TaxID=182062 RepID=A0A8H5LS76_9AGAR|nr:hypothetical protein D9758_003784 [Tetrapyrgos nigripes]